VQGVGFRPFVYQLATQIHLAGWVRNTPEGVLVEIEGPAGRVREFLLRLQTEAPPLARISTLESVAVPPEQTQGFAIIDSDRSGSKSAVILPDMATCLDCLADVFDPANRRYRYPFTNCTNCGPRYSIIEGVPYDRASTTMKSFTMCEQCRAEYEDPRSRRFHAQPNACPSCGPRLRFVYGRDDDLTGDEALRAAEQAIAAGKVVAVKGLGGFHLFTDARSSDAVGLLRSRKGRRAKPFALMAPDLAVARELCIVSGPEEIVLRSREAPIVLLRRRPGIAVAPEVAPGNPYLGIMLPYAPLHHLLLRDLGFPVVATSGNRCDEPICTDNDEAIRRLEGIADVFLLHDRPIERPIDDSVVQIVMDKSMVLRRSRGYAPLPVLMARPLKTAIGAGGNLKTVVELARGNQVFLSQHIGDLETEEALEAYTRALTDLPKLYDAQPAWVACDFHPDYASTRRAGALNLPSVPVQHHHAHVLSVVAEHGIEGPALGIAWDGTGYGEDGTVWGGEFLAIDRDLSFKRAAHLRTFLLPGGDRAVREPRRCALGMLYEIFGRGAFGMQGCPAVGSFSETELRILATMLESGLNACRTSSAGRLFDGLAAILGMLQIADFEGQAAMGLEFGIGRSHDSEIYDFAVVGPGQPWVVDWEPMLRSVLAEARYATTPNRIAARIHNTLVQMLVAVAERHGERRVVLSGGCFQNRYLLQHSIEALELAGHDVFWNQTIPTNDGGIALGQVMALAARGD